MSNLRLLLFDGDDVVGSWDIDPASDAMDVADLVTGVGTIIYDHIRECDPPPEASYQPTIVAQGTGNDLREGAKGGDIHG